MFSVIYVCHISVDKYHVLRQLKLKKLNFNKWFKFLHYDHEINDIKMNKPIYSLLFYFILIIFILFYYYFFIFLQKIK